MNESRPVDTHSVADTEVTSTFSTVADAAEPLLLPLPFPPPVLVNMDVMLRWLYDAARLVVVRVASIVVGSSSVSISSISAFLSTLGMLDEEVLSREVQLVG